MKALRYVAGIVAGLTLLATGAYVLIYLYRWQWNRALISGVFFLAAEVGVVAWLVNSRIGTLRRTVQAGSGSRADRIAGHLRDASRTSPSHAFAWLRPDASRTNVFIPLLMGAGLLMSAMAWVVERLGRATAGATVDQSLAEELARLGLPAGGFLDDSADPLRRLRGPESSLR